MAPKAALNPIEVRLSGGLLALNRLIMTFLNKRMPVAGFTVGRDAGGMRATILLDCPPETARRYAALLSSIISCTLMPLGIMGYTFASGSMWKSRITHPGCSCAHFTAASTSSPSRTVLPARP